MGSLTQKIGITRYPELMRIIADGGSPIIAMALPLS